MGTTVIGFLLGLAVGVGAGGVEGGMAGGAIGLLLGYLVYCVSRLRSRVHGTALVERHEVMCFPYGQAAECEFEGDRGRGRWTNVRQCSLLPASGAIDCDKGCVRLMNLAHVRPGHACRCQTTNVESGVEARA